jgi:hypothetical protein
MGQLVCRYALLNLDKLKKERAAVMAANRDAHATVGACTSLESS